MTPLDGRVSAEPMEVGGPVRALLLRSPVADGLVARARHGDVEAFTALYHRYKRPVWNLAAFMLHDRGEAEDATQETFLKAYRGLARCRSDDDVPGWLMTICRNTCLDRVRAAGRRAPLLSLEDEAPEQAAHDDDHDRIMDLRAALDELPFDDVEAFFLVDVLGLHSDEAAVVVGLQASSTLRSRLARARRHLAESLG